MMKISKKLFFAITLVVIVIAAFLIYSKFHKHYDISKLGKTIKFTDVFSDNSSKISELRMRISNDKNEVTFKTTDKNKINEFINLMKTITFTKESNQTSSKHWVYSIELVSGQNKNDSLLISFPHVYFTKISDKSSSSPYYSMDNSGYVLKQLTAIYNELKHNKNS